MASILVLEDMIERITWLEQACALLNVKIIWEKTVKGFLRVLESAEASEIRVIILDHDLGAMTFEDSSILDSNSTFPVDEDGSTGMTAVNEMKGLKDVPVVVWSINPPASQQMVQKLLENGYAAASLPFSSKRSLITRVIHAAI